MSLTYHLQEVIDAKIRSIDLQNAYRLQKLFDAEQIAEAQDESVFLDAIEAYTSNKGKLLFLKRQISQSNAELIIDLLAENQYIYYTDYDLGALFEHELLRVIAA